MSNWTYSVTIYCHFICVKYVTFLPGSLKQRLSSTINWFHSIFYHPLVLSHYVDQLTCVSSFAPELFMPLRYSNIDTEDIYFYKWIRNIFHRVCWKHQNFHKCIALVKISMFSTGEMTYNWYLLEKCKFSLYFILFRRFSINQLTRL